MPEPGEMVIFSGNYVYGDGISLEAWNHEEPYAMITENIPGVDLAENEVIIHHDLVSCNGWDGHDFLGELIEYIADGDREISFGPWNTKTKVIRLKENWRDLTVPMEVV